MAVLGQRPDCSCATLAGLNPIPPPPPYLSLSLKLLKRSSAFPAPILSYLLIASYRSTHVPAARIIFRIIATGPPPTHQPPHFRCSRPSDLTMSPRSSQVLQKWSPRGPKVTTQLPKISNGIQCEHNGSQDAPNRPPNHSQMETKDI